MSDEIPFVFTLECEARPDGGLRICAPQIPGLVLSGHNPRDVLRDVWPAIQAIIRLRQP